MSDEQSGERPPASPRQHAYPTAVPQGESWGPPGGSTGPGAGAGGPSGGPAWGTGTWGPGNGTWGPGGGRGRWSSGGPTDNPGGWRGRPAGGGPGGGNGGWGGPAGGGVRRRGSPRGLIWGLVITGVVVLLLGAHRINTDEIILFCILIPSLILHEVSHGAVALAFGDDTAKRAGRITLNPLRHVDLWGTLIVPAITVIAGFGFFGWAKPVPVNVSRLRSPRNHGLLVSLAGPATNVALAAVFGLLFHFAFVAGRTFPAVTGLVPRIVYFAGVVNLWVAFFNMVPVPPLDGSALLERLLPASWWPGYLRFRPYGLVLIIGGLVLLSWARVYPLASIFIGITHWWFHLLGL